MIDFARHRTKLAAAAEQRKAQKLALEQDATPGAPCEHDWQRFRQTISADNVKWAGGQAYFVVLGFPKCRSKRTIDYALGAAI